MKIKDFKISELLRRVSVKYILLSMVLSPRYYISSHSMSDQGREFFKSRSTRLSPCFLYVTLFLRLSPVERYDVLVSPVGWVESLRFS